MAPLVFGDPDADRVIVTHHTLVRPNGDDEDRRPPRLAAELPALQDRLLAGDTTAAEGFTDGRPTRWVRPFHPAFQLRLNRPPGGTRAAYRRSVDFTTGETTATCSTWTSRVFVSRADDVIVQHVTAPTSPSTCPSTPPPRRPRRARRRPRRRPHPRGRPAQPARPLPR